MLIAVDCFVFVWVLTCRDISFLCDAVGSQKKLTPLPPLTDRSGTGSEEVSPHSSAAGVDTQDQTSPQINTNSSHTVITLLTAALWLIVSFEEDK